MKTFLSIAALCIAGVFFPQISARAADVPRDVVEPAAAPKDNFAVNWYLRLDGSAGLKNEPKSEYVIPGPPVVGPIDYRREKLASFAAIGGGVGFEYRFLRFDMTIDMRSNSRYTGYVPPFNNWAYVGPFPVPSRRDRFDLKTRTFLFNAYTNLGTWRGFTPYVGVGIGTSYLKASNYVSEPLPQTAALGGVTTRATLGGAKQWNLSWALMLGVSWNITQQLKMDAAYRFVDMGNFRFNHINTATGTPSANIRTKNIRAHEFRFGLRYYLAARQKAVPEIVQARY